MKTLYAALIGVVAWLMVAPLAVAGTQRAFPSWDQQINKPKRFKVLDDFAGAAVLDKETGLVWEQSPDTNQHNWFNGLVLCYQRATGGRQGWRFPTIEELASLIDPNNPGGNPDLPPGHPFSNVQSSVYSIYWSATTHAGNTSWAWVVVFSNGSVSFDVKTDTVFVWCVRGGQGIDGVQ
jgi:hypothetical protein